MIWFAAQSFLGMFSMSFAAIRREARVRLPLFLSLLCLCAPFSSSTSPNNLDHSAFALGDSGVNLNVVYLVRQGFRPGVDFGICTGC